MDRLAVETLTVELLASARAPVSAVRAIGVMVSVVVARVWRAGPARVSELRLWFAAVWPSVEW